MADNTLTIGYWASPGKIQPSRYLLEISGIKYNDNRYTNRDDWFNRDKQVLGLSFPNLPYLIDGEVKITESETIFDYLIQRLNLTELLGKDSDKYTVDTIRNFFSDLASKYGMYYVTKGDDQAKILNEQIIPKLKQLHQFLGKKEYLVGYFTAADIYFLAYINTIKNRLPDTYNQFSETFDPLLARLKAIPQIASYISEGRHP